jgi:transcriptional regulator PpsR
VELLLSGVRATGRADEVRVQLEEDSKDIIVSASPFRQESTTYLLVRLGIPVADADAIVLPKAKTKLLKLVENVPDAFVVTGQDGRIMTANAAFLDMAQLPNEDQALGEPLERWLGQPGVELEVLTASLRQRGPVRLFATTMRGEYGATTDVEISAVSVMNGVGPCYGFAIRDVGPRVTAPARASTRTPRSVEQLTELIGQVPLKDLVREATDVIERLCIEAALELTGDNRASAAEMLGLSRQSLYVKLRRYGLGDLPADGSGQG